MFATIRRIGYVTDTTLFFGFSGMEMGESFDKMCRARLDCSRGLVPHTAEEYGTVVGAAVGLFGGVAIMFAGMYIEQKRQEN